MDNYDILCENKIYKHYRFSIIIDPCIFFERRVNVD